MKRYKGLVVAGLLMTVLGAFGAVAFVQTAQPLAASGPTLISTTMSGSLCPAPGMNATDRSCQDIHKQFLSEGDLTQADYARILDEMAKRELVTCLKTSRRTATLDGVI